MQQQETSAVNIELTQIEIYSPLNPHNLADIVGQQGSPVFIEKKGKDIYFSLRGIDSIIGGGMINEYSQSTLDKNLHDKLLGIMNAAPNSEMWTDEKVSEGKYFIPNFKPVIDYIKARGLNFCVIGRDEEDKADLIGYHVNGKTVVNPDFKYVHKQILE